MENQIVFSSHARHRMAQRNLSKNDVEYVIKFGTQSIRGGAVHYFLRKKDIPRKDACDNTKTRLEGTTVLTSSSNRRGSITVITVYRNKSAFRKIRRKSKYNNKKNYGYDKLPLAE